MEQLRSTLNIQNPVYWITENPMKQPYFCYMLNGYTLDNKDCCCCNKCGGKK